MCIPLEMWYTLAPRFLILWTIDLILCTVDRRNQQSTISTMHTYYDFDNMELGNSCLRVQYVIGYAIKIILVGYWAVTETARSSSSEIQKRLARTVKELVKSDEVIVGAPAQFKEELKLAPSLVSNTAKESENTWKHALQYKKDIKNWNAQAPMVKEVPSGVTNPTLWRHLRLRQRLFVEKNSGKTDDEMPNHFKPSIVWPAYVSQGLISDHKINVIDNDDDVEPLRHLTKSRCPQQDDSRTTKNAKRTHVKAAATIGISIQRRQQHHAEQLLFKKLRIYCTMHG